MADTAYTDNVTVITADTMNDLNRLHYTVLADPTNANDIRKKLWVRGADTASAATVTIPTDGNYFHITGTTTITGFSAVSNGYIVRVVFEGALTLTYNGTSFILPGGASIVTTAGDTAEFVNESAANWRCTKYNWFSREAFTSGIAVDDIDEKTTNNGVNIDGVLLKDSALASGTIDLTAVTLTGTRAQFNTAMSDGDFATLAGSETLTSKTLTDPVLNGNVTGTAMAGQTSQEAASSITAIVSPGSQHYHPSALKVWVAFNGATGVVTQSYKVTSVTDNGTGDFTTNYSVTFSGTINCITCAGGNGNAGHPYVSAQNATSCRTVNSVSGAFSAVDIDQVFVMVSGDLA